MAKRTALVTGGNRGIGLEIVRRLGLEGFDVYLGARSTESGENAVRTLHRENVEPRLLMLDVADMKSIYEAYGVVSGQIKKLDALVNNAGILLGEETGILETSPEIIEQSLRTNALGALFVTQAFSPLLKKGSRVINVSSTAGQIANGMSSYAPAYSISKTTMNAITCKCAHALASRGVAVNAVSPGWVKTDMGGSSAPKSVKEGADTVVWLATEAPAAETGKFWRDRSVIPW
jgi:NAD(P)-dependent dehydrogenase (short-subunit alcohol dehydrogenase family)